ncbi:MAG: metallophosphoesterase family protein, partial [Promethearchaeota archaeon]
GMNESLEYMIDKYKDKSLARYKLFKRNKDFDDEIRLLVISDTHFTNDFNFKKDVYMQAVNQINSFKKIDFVLHLGDITNNGTQFDYIFAKEMLGKFSDELREKTFFIPGNHDVKNVGDKLYEEYVSAERNFIIELPGDSVIIGIDSTEPDEDQGEIGFKTIKMFEKIFEQYSGLKIACFHHQLIPIPNTGRERSAIIDAGNVLKMLLDKDVNLVINGHRHITNIYNITDGDGELIVFNVGTLSSKKTRYKQLWTYSIIDIKKDEIVFVINSVLKPEVKSFFNRPFFASLTHSQKVTEADLLVRVIHMSNTSFSSENSHDEQAWKKAVEVINSTRCDLVMHSGNIVGRPYEENFILAADLLKEIDHPLLMVPGLNETHYPMTWNYFEKHLGSLNPYYEANKLLAIGINSCQLQTRKGIIGRRVMRSTIELAKKRLKEKIVLLLLFHDLVPAPNERWEWTLTDSGDSLNHFANSGIDFICSGSSYENWSVQIEDAIFSSCGAISDKKAVLHSPIGNTFNIINIYGDGTTIIEEYQVKNDRKTRKRIFKIPILE